MRRNTKRCALASAIAVAMLCGLAGCGGIDCPEGTERVTRSRLGGKESFCQQNDGRRHGPYRFTSSAINVDGTYVDGRLDDEWRWIPKEGPTRLRTYQRGEIVEQVGYLGGERHGHFIKSVPVNKDGQLAIQEISDFDPRTGRGSDALKRLRRVKSEESEWECGRRLWARKWAVDGTEQAPGGPIDYDWTPQKGGCKNAWRTYQERLRRGDVVAPPELP